MKVLLTILFLFLSLLLPFSAAAQEGTSSADVQQEEQDSNEYILPYPGILPDSPLYKVKMARDMVVGFLISDPIKKAEFDLLQADKRLQGGVYLIQKDKKYLPLANSTILKGQNYFEEAIMRIRDAKNQKREVGDMPNKLIMAARKHKLVLTDATQGLSKEEKRTLEQAIKRVEQFEKDATRIKNQKENPSM